MTALGIDDVLSDEPQLPLVGPNNIADQQIVGSIVAALGRAPSLIDVLR